MSQGKPNYLARAVAVLALFAAFGLVIATILTSGGEGDDGDGDGKSIEANGVTREGQRALDRGVWIVEEGDTLVSISEATGIDLDELVELNADVDPQALISGQRISLRAGQAGSDEDRDSTTTDPGADPADEFGDGSVGDAEGSGSSDGVTSP